MDNFDLKKFLKDGSFEKNNTQLNENSPGFDNKVQEGTQSTDLGEDPNMLSEASKGAMNYFSDLKYNYQKAFRYLDVKEREEYKQLVKDFFSKLQVDNKVRAVDENKNTPL